MVAAMGSDRAPHPEIDGALAAARDLGGGVILVGQGERVEPELRRCGWRRDGDLGVEFAEAAEVIGMDEPVAQAVRRKKRSSLRVGAKLVAEGSANGMVSAGNTGAAMATAKMVIGTLPGVDRPALAALIPTKAERPVLLLDVGANSDCTPHQMAQFAMADIIITDGFTGNVSPFGLKSERDYIDFAVTTSSVTRDNIAFIRTRENRCLTPSLFVKWSCSGT